MADSHEEDAHGEKPEAWMAPIEGAFVDRGALIVRDILADSRRIIDPDGLIKALAPGGGLTRQQIDDLKLLIRQHYTCHLAPDFRNAFWKIPNEAIYRWRAAGVLGPTGAWALHEPIDDAVLAARLAEVLDTGASYATMKRLAAERPRSQVEEFARQLALERTHFALDAMAWRHADAVARLAIEDRQRAVNAMVARFVGGTLTAHRRPVTAIGTLAQVMRERLRAGDIERDWRRVAATETRYAVNYGSLVHYQDRDFERVYFRVHPDACASCKRLLLRDGVPIVFPLGDLLAEIAAHGGTNIGRREADWRPTLVIHPWCRCQIMPFVERMPFVPPRHVL
jgi:hypothetical protein